MQEIDWRAEIVRNDGSTVVPDVTDARFDWDITRPIVAGGSIVTRADLGDLIGARLRLALDGYSMGWFSVSASAPTFDSAGASWVVEFMDDASRLEKTRLMFPLGLAAETPVVTAIRARLAKVGLSATLADNDETLRTAKAWPAGTATELQVINDLLGTIGFHGLWYSEFGLFAEKHPDPRTATVAHVFKEGEESFHVHSYALDSDYMAIPNRLLVTSPGDKDSTSLMAVAQDVNSSPWSFNARGFWVDAEPVVSDYTTQQGLAEDAERRLRALQSAAVTLRLQHIWTPQIVPGCVIEIDSPNLDVAGRWQVTSSSISSGVSALATTNVRKA